MASVKQLSDPVFYKGADRKNIKQGYVFPVPIMVAGAILIGLSAFLMLDETPKWMGGIAALTIGIILLFSSEGLDIDLKGGRYKEWNRWFGIRVGVWKPLDVIQSVSIILETDTGKLYPVTEHSPELTEDYFQVFMMNENHLYKVFVAHSKKRAEAEAMAKNLANWLKVDVQTFNPPRHVNHKR